MSAPELLPYLLQVNGALALFCAIYYLGLRRLTFFGLNRAFLLFALLFAPTYPLLDFGGWLARTAPRSAEVLRPPADWPTLALPPATTVPAAINWLLLVYWIGVMVFGLRLLVQLLAVRRLHRRSRPQELHGRPFRCLPGPVMPFAFWQTVYLNPARHPAAELPAILAHEHAHVRLWHTLDILLAQLSLVFCWFNPGGWLLRRALHENLEFQADYRVLRARPHEARAYQYALLHQSIGRDPANEIVCHFNFHLLKTRIAMMNARPSSPRQLLRYAAGLTVLATLAVGCATPKVAELPVPISAQQDARSYSIDKLTYFLNGLPSTKEEVFNMPDKGSDSGNGGVNRLHMFKGTKPGQNVDMAALRRDFGSKLDDGIVLMVTAGSEQMPAVQDFVRRYSIKLADQSAILAQQTLNRDYYRKLVDGKGLTDAEIGGRLLIDKVEVTPEQLRALPAGAVSALSISDGPVPKYGARGQKGLIFVMTKDRAK